jgi:hypothetical protein
MTVKGEDPPMRPPRWLLPLTALAGLALGCGGLGHRVRFNAPPQSVLMGGVAVDFRAAHARAHKIHVHFYLRNLASDALVVSRDGIGLRLPDGRVLPREGYVHDTYVIAPGQGHDVIVEFIDPAVDLRTVGGASVVVGGVSYVSDPTPRTVGEIPLQQVGAPVE